MSVILETSRLIIRKCSLQDVKSLQAVLGDPEVMRYSFKETLNEAGIVEYVNRILSQYERHGYGLWCLVLKETDELVGLAGLIYQLVEDVPYIELAYRLVRRHWGKGFATEAANAIKEYAFNTLNIDRLISIIEPNNTASAKVARKIGMTRAKSTKFHEFNVDIYDVQKIVLLSYDPDWPMLYGKEKEMLSQVFGEFFIEFHHIGSTSIPGCFAKPNIDILGITSDVLQIDKFNNYLEEVGYIALGEYGMKQRRFFRKRAHSFVNLHIFEDSDPEAARHLRFRDYLTSHPEETKRYSELKQDLAAKNSTDIMQYILGKEKFIKNIDYKAAMQMKGKYWHKNILPRKTAWSNEEIINAMEANMHLQMTYFAKYLPTMNICFEPDVTVVMSEIADDTFNYVIGAQFDDKNAEARILHVLELFRSKNHPFSWWVSERDKPKSLVALLEKYGLSAKEEDIGMSLLLETQTFDRKIKALLIERAFEQKVLKDFSQVMVSIGGYPQVYEQFFKEIPPVLYTEGAPFEIYVGYIEGVPIVTGILVLHANVGGIYYIMTHPDYRKHGYGTEMMTFLLLRAKNRGYHLATLQASASGRNLYQKLGFEPKCRFVELDIPHGLPRG